VDGFLEEDRLLPVFSEDDRDTARTFPIVGVCCSCRRSPSASKGKLIGTVVTKSPEPAPPDRFGQGEGIYLSPRAAAAAGTVEEDQDDELSVRDVGEDGVLLVLAVSAE
jgi:hypothetical protein